jgi:hypothetical protein
LKNRGFGVHAGGPAGLPAFFVLLLVLAGCGEKPGGFPEQGGVLWEVPALPAPVELEVNGQRVDQVVVDGYLLSPWAEHWSQSAAEGRQPHAEGFFEQPRELFTPLVRGMLLIHAAETRWPVLEDEAVWQLQAEMQAGAGGVYRALLDRIGESGMRAHLAREVRKRRLLDEFAAEIVPLTDEDLYRRYDELMAGVDEPELLIERGLDFSALEPKIRAELTRERAIAVQEAWIDEHLPSTHVRVTLPGGRVEAW